MGIQISGLLQNEAFDWKSIVDQLMEVEAVPIKRLEATKVSNDDKSLALSTLQTGLQDLQDSVQAMRVDEVFSARTVASDTVGTTWKSSSVTGTAIGTYKIAVSQLATAAKRQGAAGIASGLSATSDVSGVTLATMRTATAPTAGTFTVNGQTVTVALTDSLQDVFDNIALADPDVTASYDETTDKITLTDSSGELVLGAANDTSNFLSVLKLANNGTGTTTSSARLGAVANTATLANSGLAAAITAVDGTGAGSFTINGKSISYNVNTDSLAKVINRINDAGAGVIASYDSAADRMTLTNKLTGDTGLGVSEATGGLLDALGLSTAAGGALVHGKNAQFTVNDGATISSASNTLDASVHGITGLSVTVNSATTQTLQVESDTVAMETSIKAFIEKFNGLQEFIEENTKVSVTGTKVSTALLSDNREVQEWSRKLQSLAFEAVSGLTGSVTRLDSLGIDFNGVTGKLAIKDAGKLATALGDHPDDVESFFLKSSGGFVTKLYGYLTNIKSANLTQQDRLATDNSDIDEQIVTLQTRLDNQREILTSSFIKMLEAQSAAQSQNTYLTNQFFKNNNN